MTFIIANSIIENGSKVNSFLGHTMISKRQKQIYGYIEKFINKHDYSPSLEEIKKHLRLSSVSTIHHHILNLEKAGLIKKEKNEPRTIELKKTRKDLAKIPLMGIIAAGEPIEAITENEIIEVSKAQLSNSGTHYALRVRGNSMIDEGIYNGDMVIIREQPTADNGDTVVALINNNEVTLKKIYKENNRFRLQP
ncbi:MAG: repressor LexA, partial [Elusimicrobia bacterium RIFCSPLOWO2_12_FULL_39_28]